MQSRNLAVQMQGEDVGLLQRELRQHGCTISAEEAERKTFGAGAGLDHCGPAHGVEIAVQSGEVALG